MIGAVVFCILVFALAWLSSKRRIYKSIFAETHFIELAQKLQEAKTAALALIATDDVTQPITSEDPRVIRTSANMAIVYTISYRDKEFLHHYSLSIAGQHTPDAIGATFTVYLARLLGMDLVRLTASVSKSNVFHAEFILSAEEQTTFAVRAVEIPSLENVYAIYGECIRRRSELYFERMDTDVRDGGRPD